MTDFFKGLSPVQYEGPDSTSELAFRHYNPDEMVMGKRLEDHLRFAVAWWHSFAWPGGDPFGGQTFDRPWFGDTIDLAKLKGAEVTLLYVAPDIAPAAAILGAHSFDTLPPADIRTISTWLKSNSLRSSQITVRSP